VKEGNKDINKKENLTGNSYTEEKFSQFLQVGA
jgi:hypothetical protein